MENQIFNQKRSINHLVVFKYAVIFLLLFILWRAGIKNNIFPFAIGLFIAFVWCNQNIWIVAVEFILSAYLSYLNIETMIIATACGLFVIIVYHVHKYIKKPIKLWLLIIYAVVSRSMIIFYNYSTAENLISAVISIAVAVIFMVACIKICKVVLVKGVALKLTIDEIICLSLLLLSLSLGLSSITIININLAKIFAVFCILICVYVYNGSTAAIVGCILGVGEALATNNLILSAGYALLALGALTFKTSHPYYSVLALIFVELILGLYFNIYGGYTVFDFLSVIIGVTLFLIVSKSAISVLKIMMGADNNVQASRNIVNRSKDSMCKRMFEISNIFMEMDKIYRGMVKGVLPQEEAKRMLTQEVMQKVCVDCPERHKCLRVLAEETSKVFDDLVTAGFERGKTTILDVPPFLTTRCGRVNTILQAINQLLVSYKQYSNMVNSMDTSRILIADQLFGISQLLKALATETQKNITFDTDKEAQILEELTYNNIVASEVVLYEQDTETFCVTMVVRQIDKDSDKILKILNNICGSKMVLTLSQPSQTPYFYINEYKTAPKYDLVYGSCGCPKNGNTVSGDSYSFIKLTQDKVLLAICDGMGSGSRAQQTSDTAISLIENFYKAGFDNDIILNSVNRFLSLSSDEDYSALDLCIVDLKTSVVDFIKLGAPEGFLKHNQGVEVLQSGALPLGILDDIKPTITAKTVCSNDIIVLCSDGVLDSFDGVENLQVYLNNISTLNPQTISQNILDEALNRCDNMVKDDCTVICARVFNRV